LSLFRQSETESVVATNLEYHLREGGASGAAGGVPGRAMDMDRNSLRSAVELVHGLHSHRSELGPDSVKRIVGVIVQNVTGKRSLKVKNFKICVVILTRKVLLQSADTSEATAKLRELLVSFLESQQRAGSIGNEISEKFEQFLCAAFLDMANPSQERCQALLNKLQRAHGSTSIAPTAAGQGTVVALFNGHGPSKAARWAFEQEGVELDWVPLEHERSKELLVELGLLQQKDGDLVNVHPSLPIFILVDGHDLVLRRFTGFTGSVHAVIRLLCEGRPPQCFKPSARSKPMCRLRVAPGALSSCSSRRPCWG